MSQAFKHSKPRNIMEVQYDLASPGQGTATCTRTTRARVREAFVAAYPSLAIEFDALYGTRDAVFAGVAWDFDDFDERDPSGAARAFYMRLNAAYQSSR